MIEHGVGITSRIVSMLAAGRSHLNQVWLPHPPVASRATYRRHLGAPVEFDAPLAALSIDRGDLDLTLGEHNEELRARAVDFLGVPSPAGRHLTSGAGPTGWSNDCWARACAATPRWPKPSPCTPAPSNGGCGTRARPSRTSRTKSDGTWPSDTLAHPEVPLGQITALLDYSEQSALTRSCHRWFHTTPTALRASLSSGTPAVA